MHFLGLQSLNGWRVWWALEHFVQCQLLYKMFVKKKKSEKQIVIVDALKWITSSPYRRLIVFSVNLYFLLFFIGHWSVFCEFGFLKFKWPESFPECELKRLHDGEKKKKTLVQLRIYNCCGWMFLLWCSAIALALNGLYYLCNSLNKYFSGLFVLTHS